MVKIKRLDKRKIRKVWNEKDKKFYFAIGDVFQALTGTVNPTDFLKKKRKREKDFSKKWKQSVRHLPIITTSGKQLMNCADAGGVLNIIQSVNPPIPESFKLFFSKALKQKGRITLHARKRQISKTGKKVLKTGKHLKKLKRK